MLSGKADWRIMRSVYPNQVDVKETSTDGDPKKGSLKFQVQRAKIEGRRCPLGSTADIGGRS